MTAHKLPPASAYESHDLRYADYKLIMEGKPPIHARSITEADASPELDVDIPPLHQLRTADPEAYKEIRRAFANEVFAGHDNRRDGGHSPFNRGWTG